MSNAERQKTMARSAAKNGGKYTTTRTIYKSVKKYDHMQFDAFCTKVYAEGFRDGAESVPGTDITEIMKAIEGVKGIGPVMIKRISEALDKCFAEVKADE